MPEFGILATEMQTQSTSTSWPGVGDARTAILRLQVGDSMSIVTSKAVMEQAIFNHFSVVFEQPAEPREL
jgi:hypothetical protein